MGPGLIERWTAGGDWLDVLDGASTAEARQLVRHRAAEAGLTSVQAEALATATSELVTNQLRHARQGRLAVRPVRRAGVSGVEVIAADRGAGIPDPVAALAGRSAPSGSLGAGLGGARRLTQEMDLDVRVGEGTCVRVRTFATSVPRSVVAIYGRPFPGELSSGDDAVFVRGDETLLLAVADGLGHGREARAASAAAIDAVAAAPTLALPELVQRCAAAVEGTRGVVLALVRLHLVTRQLERVGVGDVRTLLLAPGRLESFPGSPGLLSGRQGERPRAARQTADQLSPHGALLLFTDGLRSAAAPAPGPAGEPMALAHDLAVRFGRDTDDLLVLAARSG